MEFSVRNAMNKFYHENVLANKKINCKRNKETCTMSRNERKMVMCRVAVKLGWWKERESSTWN